MDGGSKEPPAPGANATEGKWFWSDGVEGEGESPGWFQKEKYKTRII